MVFKWVGYTQKIVFENDPFISETRNETPHSFSGHLGQSTWESVKFYSKDGLDVARLYLEDGIEMTIYQ